MLHNNILHLMFRCRKLIYTASNLNFVRLTSLQRFHNFTAKSSGADAVKLMCSVLTVQEVSYLVKIGRAIGDLMCVAVVSSKSQLLELLAPGAVPGLQAVSISSRNMRLWKVVLPLQ